MEMSLVMVVVKGSCKEGRELLRGEDLLSERESLGVLGDMLELGMFDFQ